jgi:hypothetical protein
MKNHSSLMLYSISVTSALLITGCASIPAPTEQIAVSKVALESANGSGGNEFAPVLLKSAMDKLDAAEQAMRTEDYALAKQLAEQAQVDAQLAGATARSAKAQKAASALLEGNRVLRQELNRKTQ